MMARSVALDVLKGFLVWSMVVLHLPFFIGGPRIAGTVSGFAGDFRFGCLFLAYGIGSALSKRPKPWRPLLALTAIYFAGAVLMVLLVTERDPSLWPPDRTTMAPGWPSDLSGGLADVVTLRRIPRFVDFVLPYVVAYAIILLTQRFGRHATISVAVGMACVGLTLDAFEVQPPWFSGLWREGFHSLQALSIFAVGFVAAPLLGRIPTTKWAWPWITVLAAAAIIMPNLALQACRPFTGSQSVKMSGHPVYGILAALVLATYVLLVQQFWLRWPDSWPIHFFNGLGKRTLPLLGIQIVGLPLIALLIRRPVDHPEIWTAGTMIALAAAAYAFPARTAAVTGAATAPSTA